MNYLVLERNQPGRRAGLTKSSFSGPTLLEKFKVPSEDPRSAQSHSHENVPSLQEKTQEEDLLRPPESTSDEDSADEDPRAKIRHSVFKVVSDPEILAEKVVKTSRITRRNTSSSLLAGTRKSPTTATSSNKSTSRANESELGTTADLSKAGFGMEYEFGGINKKRKVGYGSKSQRSGSSTKSKFGVSQESPKPNSFKLPSNLKFPSDPYYGNQSDSEHEPALIFKGPPSEVELPPNRDAESPRPFKKLDLPNLESPVSSAVKDLQFHIPETTLEPEDEEAKALLMSGCNDSTDYSRVKIHRIEATASARSSNMKPNLRQDLCGSPATQLPTFQAYQLDCDLTKNLDYILKESRNPQSPLPCFRSNEDEFTASSPRPCCPMCGSPIAADQVLQYAGTNTRQQEKICRAHKRSTALGEWGARGYPEIDWDGLDVRISEHHAFVQGLINGNRSHYRTLLEETVKAGKDRNLLKMQSSLTPGYYGPRGLRIISENIMKRFTPLLKKRAVTDRLMAARGVTSFVQSVVVPEVATILIQHDMSADIVGARVILAESIGVGELVSEEGADRVLHRVQDSEDEESDRDN